MKLEPLEKKECHIHDFISGAAVDEETRKSTPKMASTTQSGPAVVVERPNNVRFPVWSFGL